MLIEYSACSSIIKNVHGEAPKKVLHVGAHLGEEVIPYYSCQVEECIWFEANKDLIKTLEENLTKLPIKSQIIPLALWNSNNNLVFKVTNNMQSSSFFELETHKEHYPQIQVIEEKRMDVYRLDYLIEHESKIMSFHDFEFINIDTQGAELAILEGLGRYINQESIKGIYLEVNKESLYNKIPLIGQIDEYLSKYNFKRIVTKWTDAGWGDAFYIKTREN